MKTLKTVEELMEVPEGTKIWCFNPYDAGNPLAVKLHEYVVAGADPRYSTLFIESSIFTFKRKYATDMVRPYKKVFLDKEEAEAFLAEYHKGPQYPAVVEHHTSCAQQYR